MKDKIVSQIRKFWEFFNNNIVQIMIVVGLLLFFVVISVFTSNSYEDAAQSGFDISNFNEGWTFVYQGQRQTISYLPEKYDVAPGDVYVIENVLPEGLDDQMVLTLHGSRSNVAVFIAGENVFRYEAPAGAFDTSPLSKVIFIPLKAEYSGQSITIQFQSYYTRYSGRVDELYYGPFEECMDNVLHIQMPIFLLYSAFLVVGLIMLLALPFIRSNKRKYLSWTFLGAFIILFSIHFILEYNMMQFWSRNENMMNMIYWITLLLYPLAYLLALVFTVDWQPGRMILKGMIILWAAISLSEFYKQSLGEWDLPAVVDGYRMLIYIGFVLSIVIVVGNMIRCQAQHLLSVFFSQIMVLQVLWVHVLSFYYYPMSYKNGGLIFAAGLLSSFVILLGATMNKTSRSLEEAAQVKKDLLESRIQLMIHQIQPHFIFNSLNSIQALIDLDPERASEMLTHFSKYLRTHIDTMEMEKMISFQEELQNIKEYASIETMRFPRLHVIYDVKADQFLVPALSIQPLVENAIKHGISPKPAGGHVYIRSWEEKGAYVLCVEDDGVGFEQKTGGEHKGKGYVGMKNTVFRLNTLINATVQWDSEPGCGTTVTVHIPKKTEGKAIE